MRKQAAGKSRTFFIEFLIVLFFFLIIGTVCLRVFVAAHKVTRDADALAHAQSTAASIAEVLSAGEEVEDYFPEMILLADAGTDAAAADGSASTAVTTDADSAVGASDGLSQRYQMTWNSDFSACSSGSDSVYYTLTLQLDTADHMQTAAMTFTDVSGETLYELTVTYHLALTGEEALS
ncbi:MAG: hypothetical protein LUI39_09690 [Lachnospiraceae bacterium]|nr:hypothetical protein [Lachnospiraceae bacterium]